MNYSAEVFVELKKLGFYHLVRRFIPDDREHFNKWLDEMIKRGRDTDLTPAEIANVINQTYWAANRDKLEAN